MEQKVLIIADDEELNRLVVKALFEKQHIVYEAANGLEVLELLKTLPHVDAVFLDIFMTTMGGFEVLTALRQDAKFAYLPVIVITSSNETDIQIKSLNMGATEVIAKPINPTILWHRFNNLMVKAEAELLRLQHAQVQIKLDTLRTDPISGICNKYAFHADLHSLLDDNLDQRYVLLRWDLNHFKLYNDSLGVQMGDRYLKGIGDYYKKRKQENGLVLCARYESEHFVCLFEQEYFDLEQEMKNIQSLTQVYAKGRFKLSPRIGLVEVNDASIDASLYCDRALLALRSTKQLYDQDVAWYDERLRTALLEEQEVIDEMVQALHHGEFVFYLQPQMDYATNTIIGAEALARWKHPIKGIIPPDTFLPIFERSGFISEFDRYIWESACKQIRTWLDQGKQPIKLSVNASTLDFTHFDLDQVFAELLEKYQIPPALLSVEITESACMEYLDDVRKATANLRQMGIKVYLDDFGAGFSSLNVLSALPFDLIKLDKNFLVGDYSSSVNKGIIEAIVGISKHLNTPMLIEGVETQAQAEFILGLGCNEMQGYYFSKPIALNHFETTFMEG